MAKNTLSLLLVGGGALLVVAKSKKKKKKTSASAKPVPEEPIPEEMKEEVAEWRRNLFEKVSEIDEGLLEKFCADEVISKEELREAIRRATHEHLICPVLCGSAFKKKGVQRLLDSVVSYLPSPVDLPPIIGKCLDGTEIERVPKDDGRLAALAFKVVTDPHVGKLVYVRVYSGQYKSGRLLNSTRDRQEKPSGIQRIHADKKDRVDNAQAGDILALIGLKWTTTGDTLCDGDHPLLLENIDFAEPVISIAVEPKMIGAFHGAAERYEQAA